MLSITGQQQAVIEVLQNITRVSLAEHQSALHLDDNLFAFSVRHVSSSDLALLETVPLDPAVAEELPILDEDEPAVEKSEEVLPAA